MSKKSAPAQTVDVPPAAPTPAFRPDGFVADAPVCAILSIDGETAVSGRVTTMGNVQVSFVSPHYNVALKMSGQMAVRMHAGLGDLINKLEPPK